MCPATLFILTMLERYGGRLRDFLLELWRSIAGGCRSGAVSVLASPTIPKTINFSAHTGIDPRAFLPSHSLTTLDIPLQLLLYSISPPTVIASRHAAPSHWSKWHRTERKIRISRAIPADQAGTINDSRSRKKSCFMPLIAG